MNTKNESTLHPFLEFLEHNRENTGVMADLRSALIPAGEYRAWPYIARYFRLDNDRERIVAATVAAAFALQPEDGGEKENIGDVMRKIALGEGRNSDGLTTFAARFRRLLSCDSPTELSPLLHGIFKVAKPRGIPINHRTLLADLLYWGDHVKRRWAEHYYSAASQAGNAQECECDE